MLQNLEAEGIIEVLTRSFLRTVAAMRRGERARVEIDFCGVVDALPGLVWTTHADGRSDFVNRGWSEYTGLGRDESIGCGWQTAIHSDDLASCIQSWDRIQQSGIVKEIDARLRRFDGEYRWFVFRLSPIAADDSRSQHWCWLGVDADEGLETDGRVRRLFDMLPIRAGFLNVGGVLQFSNLESRENILGTTVEQMREWTTSGIIHREDLERSHNNIRALLTTGEMFDAELRMRHRGGVYRWARARAVPIRDAQGNIVRYLSCQIDIDDLKQAEALLAAEVKLLEMVARGEPLRQVLDALSRHAESLSSGCFCSILVVSPDRVHFEVGAGPSMPDAYNAMLDGKSIDGGYGPFSLAVLDRAPIITADLANDPRWEGSTWVPLMKTFDYSSCWSMPILSVSGEASGVVAIYRRDPVGPKPQEQDLIDRFTKIAGIAIDRAQADAALQTRERELREALAQLSEGQRLSKTGSFTSEFGPDLQRWSDELYRIYEIDPVVTAPTVDAVRDRVHPDDLAAFDAEMKQRVEGRGSEFVFRIVTPTGKLKHLHAVARPMEYAAGRPTFMGIVQDITESKLSEAALNQARSELAHVARVATLNAMTASIAHEVNQPLSGILTNANTVVRMLASDPPNVAGAVETTRRAIRDVNRATDVIQRLRAMFSTKPPTMEMADLNEVAREVIALSMGELRRNGALLHTDYADGLPRIWVDRVQMQQVILNLLLNASDAMAGVEDRPRNLLVQTGLEEDGNVRLLVRDSGTGVDPDTVGRLFDAFYTTKDKGMGVGLSISRTIIERHEGRLWAESNEGHGATFGFCIPAPKRLPD